MATVCLASRFAYDNFPLSPLYTSCSNKQSTRKSQEDASMTLLSHQFSAQSLAPSSTQLRSRPTTSDSATTDDEPSPWAPSSSLFRTIDFSGGIPDARTRRHTDEHTPESYSPLDSTSSDSSRSNSVSSASSATSYASSSTSCTLSVANDKRTPRHPARPHTRYHRTHPGSPPTHRLQRRNALHADSSPRMLALLLAKASQQACAEDAEMAIDATDDEDSVDASRDALVMSRRTEFPRERHAGRMQRRKIVGCEHGPRRVT